jgi:ABC-type uncharacterized transport system permease subunit
MQRTFGAAAAYFGLVFSIGFILGTLRVLWVIPWLGEGLAVALELPVILTASWLVCGWTMRRFSPDPALRARLALGGIAFAMLMAAEALLGIVGLGRTLAEHLASYTRPLAIWGLSGQIAFALFPVLRR